MKSGHAGGCSIRAKGEPEESALLVKSLCVCETARVLVLKLGRDVHGKILMPATVRACLVVARHG